MRLHFGNFLFCIEANVVSAEQKRQTPQAGKTNYRVNNTADNCILSAEDPGNQVEFENTHKTPVQRTNYG